LNTSKTNSYYSSQWFLFIKGDNDALEIIFSDHYEHLYNYGRKLTLDKTAVEDAIQELFIDLIKYRDKISFTDNVKFYLLKSLRHKINSLRTESIELKFDISDNSYESENNNSYPGLQKQINLLSNSEREIIYLKFYNNLKNSEIAEVLNLKYQTVANHLQNAIVKLRKSGKLDIFCLFIHNLSKK
jgi:RNA polymerase sigma-70 factor (ECF subfamily)